ncbi:MAG: hypothetical protein NC830_00070 [Candidatus Omnitrophica bacterium]|nr:hypothetical protein [Candidatus Omnitrophota bacterium]
MLKIDAFSLDYRLLNEKLRELANRGCSEISVRNICGQRYIGAGFDFRNLRICLHGIPGNDLGVFMNGTEIVVYGNVQDGTGNTMNSGRIIVHGDAGDITGYSMRGGEIFIKGDAGYRTGIHMKEYKQMYPSIIVGGSAGSFLGEYMAGGIVIILNLRDEKCAIGNFAGTGMHGGAIYVRGEISEVILGEEVRVFDVKEDEYKEIVPYLERFAVFFGGDIKKICKSVFQKIVPITHRPYGKIYSY